MAPLGTGVPFDWQNKIAEFVCVAGQPPPGGGGGEAGQPAEGGGAPQLPGGGGGGGPGGAGHPGPLATVRLLVG